jgi:predicted lysophospholipase L1 biosynthesis ABC-type transport system permease subunit
VSKDIVHGEPQAGPRPWIYVALAQNHEPNAILHVNTRNFGREIREAIQRALLTLDPELPVAEIKTVQDHLKEAFVSQRLLAWNSAGFGFIALLMAMLGVYGVIAYSVAHRTQEYGVRMALGATTSDIGRLVLRQGMMVIALGIPIGLAFTAAGGRIVKSYLLGVSEADPLSLLAPPLLIAAVTLLAAYTPARRAMRVNPVDALRAE